MKIFYFLSILSIFCTGCQKHSTVEFQKKMSSCEQAIKLNNHGNLSSLHPHTGIDLQCRIFQKALFEGLMRMNPQGEAELAAADKVTISPCKTIYTFTLRPSIWTNGAPLTATHFEQAWKSAIAPVSECLRADLFYVIKNAEKAKKGLLPLSEVGIHVKDSQTLVVELEHPTPYFLDLVANPLYSPLYNDSITPSIFNGPFQIANWEPGNKLELIKNASYWDADSVSLEEISVTMIADPTTALMLYEKGEIDWVGHPFGSLPTDAISTLETYDDYHSNPTVGVYWISLNTDRFPLNSPKIRQALSVALNREELIEHVLIGESATKGVVPTALALLKESELYRDNVVEQAQKLFQEGLGELSISKEEFPTLIYNHSDIPGQKKLAEAIQRRWEKTFGIKVALQNAEWNIFFANLGERDFQIGGCIWFSAYSDPSYILEFFKNKSHRYNAPQWENTHYEQLLDLADFETDSSKRLEHLKQAESLLLEAMPIIPLYVFNAKYLKSAKVKGLFLSDLGQADFKWAYVEETANLQLTQ